MKNNKLEKLKQQREQLNARIQKFEAAEKTRERKRETRRKILIGAYYLDQAKTQDKFDEIVKLMDDYLKRNSDRSLFDLIPLKSEPSAAVTAE